MSKRKGRIGRYNSTDTTWNPSGQELDGTKRKKTILKPTGKDGRSLRSLQQSSLSHRNKTITLPKLNLPD